MPAQPPFLTPTRKPAIGFSEAEMISCTRAAAASVRVMTLNLELLDPIGLSFNRGQGPANSIKQYSNDRLTLTGPVTATPSLAGARRIIMANDARRLWKTRPMSNSP